MLIGYGHLAGLEEIKTPFPAQTAEIRSVTRKELIGSVIAVPASLAPADNTILAHVLFALKHEGINLGILAQALPLVPEAAMRASYDNSPTGQYIRKACFLWEHFTGQQIQRASEQLRTNYQPLFPVDDYLTSTGHKNTRWKILFNGIGSPDYCISVRRTPAINQLLQKNLLRQAREFTEQLPADILNRTLSWAYFDETRNSYALEQESPKGNKAQRFVQLLKQAHNKRNLDEDYLTDLQNEVIDNPLHHDASYRFKQNYLSNGRRGPLGISYVPPAPELARNLMEQLLALANSDSSSDTDPLILATIVSFGFVFIHPFMDGNGRLSRFLFHHVLCQQDALDNGLLLPVSTVLKQREMEYKAVLESWSGPTREFWETDFIADDDIHFTFTGHAAMYRYWDATGIIEFMGQVTEQAIEKHLKDETLYLTRYDELYRRINDLYDIPNPELSKLVMFCIEQKGKISKNRRKQYQYTIPEDVFEALEQEYKKLLEPNSNQD